jgi:hypothetical protein
MNYIIAIMVNIILVIVINKLLSIKFKTKYLHSTGKSGFSKELKPLLYVCLFCPLFLVVFAIEERIRQDNMGAFLVDDTNIYIAIFILFYAISHLNIVKNKTVK